MKLILTTGAHGSGFEQVQAALSASGLVVVASEDTVPAASSGTVWRMWVLRLLESLTSPTCAVCSVALDVGALDGWTGLDQDVGFVLAYAPPEFALAIGLGRQDSQPETVAAILEEWLTCHHRLLEFYHHQAGRCVLINAVAALHRPDRLVDCIQASLNPAAVPWVSAQASGFTPELSAAALLLRPWVEDSRAIRALWQELESLAHLPGDDDAIGRMQRARAWEGHVGLLRQLETSQQQFLACEARCTEQADRAVVFDAVAAEHALQISMLESELVQAHGSVLDALEAARLGDFKLAELSAQRRVDTQQRQLLESELEQQRDMVESVASQLGQQRAEFQRAEVLLAQKAAELERLAADREALKVENEILLLQLVELQVQAPPVGSPAIGVLQAEQAPAPSHLTLDMRGEIDADNWYFAEHDGRWAGPSTSSVVRLPALADGRYELRVDVVDAMNKKILAGTRVALNGKPLVIRQQGRGIRGELVAQYATDSDNRRPVWELRFDFPHVISPADSGSSDMRSLAIRVRTLSLVPAP